MFAVLLSLVPVVFTVTPALATMPQPAAVAQREGCARENLLCLDADGRPLPDERMPPRVNAGAAFEVKVLGCGADYGASKFDITAEVDANPDRLFHVDPSTPTADVAPNTRNATCTTADQVTLLKATRLTVPGDTKSVTFRVVLTRSDAAGTAVERSESHIARINHGRYFLDVGVMIPVVFGGKRKIVAEDTDQPGIKRLAVTQDLDVFPALMLNVFPGGRDLGSLGSFQVARRTGGSCGRHCHRRRAANSLGLQLGLELDLKRFDRFFLGGLFEPITGLSVNVGVAITRLEYLKGGNYPGSLISNPTAVTADGSPDLRQYIDRFWVPRLYLGVTLSFDIVRYLGDRRRSSELKDVLPQ